MRSIVAAAALFALLVAVASQSPTVSQDAAFNKEFIDQLPADDDRKERLVALMVVHKECRELRWSCQKPCRTQVPLKGADAVQACLAPSPHDKCFGAPIDYKYVSSREGLPLEYEVLKRFPKCWSVLGPMLCALTYRPCGVYDFDGRMMTSVKKMEVWQRFGIGMCNRVHEQCADAITEGFFPLHLVNCSRTAENVEWIKEKTNATGVLARWVPSGNEEELKTEWDRQTVFTEESCNIRYNENASTHDPMQCIFPLVYTMHEKIKPVIDKCFVPCRNPLISSPEKFLSFRVIRAVLCFFFAALCLAIFMFLSQRSQIYVDSHAIYSIACSLLAFSIYLAFFALGSIGFFAESSECTHTAQGVAIRAAPIDQYASMWCTISAIILHVSLLATIAFLAMAFPLSAAGATKAARREDEKEQNKGDDSSKFRAKLGFGVIIVSLVLGFAAFFLKMTSTDGVAGVCSVGLHSIIDHLTVVALPGLVFCLIALGLGVRDIWKERKQRETDVEHAIAEKIREGIDHEKAKEKFEFWTDRGPGQKEDIQQQVRRGSLPPLEEQTESGSSTSGGERGEIKKEQKEEEKEALVTTLKGDDDEKEWLTQDQKDEIADKVRREQREEWKGREKRAWYEGISSRYTLVALCLCIASLIFGLCVHYFTLANDGTREYEAIRTYVTCIMSKSILKKDVHWMGEPVHAAEIWDKGLGEADPLERRHNLASEITIHGCQYPSTGDNRLVGVLFCFVLLPLLPVSVFIWAFGAGMAGIGGMASVLTRRPKEQRADATDVEMVALTTDGDAGSQMISSVGSSQARLFPPPAPSSTASTYLTTSAPPSDASSMRSSISLRGDLPRFSSRERLTTVHATSPVPSRAHSEVIAVPERRTRSVGHHRILDVMGRARERRERTRAAKKKKTRASSADMEARREGVAESGQLVPPRNSANAVDDDAQSDYSEVAGSAVSSTMVPPSEVGRMMMRNAEILMNGGVRRQAAAAAVSTLQRDIQQIQEELYVRSLEPNGGRRAPPGPGLGPPGPGNDQDHPRNHPAWIERLQSVRNTLFAYTAESLGANEGMALSGHAINFGRHIIAFGTDHYAVNYVVLQLVLERIQTLAYLLVHGRNTSTPELAAEMAYALDQLQRQQDINTSEDRHQTLADQDLTHLEIVNLDPEVQELRDQLRDPDLSHQEREEIERRMLNVINRRSIARLAGRTYLARILPVHESPQPQDPRQPSPQQQPLEQQQVQGGQGHQPAYAHSYVVDTSQPPPGTANGLNDAPSEASFSVTNSTVASSSLTVEGEERMHRIYMEVHELPNQRPPGQGDPLSMSAASSSTTPIPSTSSAGVPEFMEMIVRANEPSRRALQTAAFAAPVSSELGMSSNASDVMSSVNSLDSVDRRRAALPPRVPAASTSFASGSFGVPVHSVEDEEAGPATGERANGHHAALRPRLFQGVNPADGPPVGTFPGGRPQGALMVQARVQPQAPMRVEPQPRPQGQHDELVNGLARLGVASHELRRREEAPSGSRSRKRKEPALEEAHHSRAAPRRRDEDDEPPRVGRVRVSPPPPTDDTDDGLMLSNDSGLASLRSLRDENAELFLVRGSRRATGEEVARFSRNVRREMEEQVVNLYGDAVAGPSNADQRRRRERLMLRNRFLNHSDPDLAMADEERERARAAALDAEREEEERARVTEARERARMEMLRQRREAGGGGPRDFGDLFDPDEESISSMMTPEEQAELVDALRHALEHRPIVEGADERIKRLVEHLRLALDTQGGISREEIMRYRVNETNRENRERQQPNRNSPYSVSSVVVSRMSLAEIGSRVDAIRRYSPGTLYPLEIYYQLHLADVVWPLAGRDVVLGDNVYTHDEINRVLGTDSPLVPADTDSDDFHQLMRKRAITAASLTGRAHGRNRGTDNFTYQPPRLPDMDLYRTLGGPAALLAAIGGDFQPLIDAINRIQLTMPDVMRLDNRSQHSLGSHLRHFRDYLDAQATVAGYPLRPDTYANDVVPAEPTGSRHVPALVPTPAPPPPPPPQQQPRPQNGAAAGNGEGVEEDDDAEPPF